MDFPSGTSGKEPTCQCRRRKTQVFDLWVRKVPWRRAWQPTPVFLPGKSREQRILAGYSPWSHKESDTTEHACIHTCMHYDPALKVPQHTFCHTLLVELVTRLLTSREVKTENIPKFEAVISGHHDLWTLHLFNCCCC